MRQVIAPLLAGEPPDAIPLDDIRFVLDLGLCRPTGVGHWMAGGFLSAQRSARRCRADADRASHDALREGG